MFIFRGWPLIIVADIGLAALLDFGRCPLGFEIVPESLAPLRFLDRVRVHFGGPGLLFVFLAHDGFVVANDVVYFDAIVDCC